MDKKIGIIGLGKMGLPMAVRLVKAGMDITVASSNPESSNKVAECGGSIAQSWQSLAERCEIILTILPADKEICEVYLSPGGLLDTLRDGSVCIEMSTAKSATKRELALQAARRGKDIRILDAPVSGGVAGAADGTLTILAGGEESLIELCRPIFDVLGSRVIHTGPLGSGSDIKILNQLLTAVHTQIAGEVVCLARSLGVDLHILWEAVSQSSGQSGSFTKNLPKYIIPRDHTPGFYLELMKKDISLGMDCVKDAGAFLPLANLAYQCYCAAYNDGGKGSNFTYIAEWLQNNQPPEE